MEVKKRIMETMTEDILRAAEKIYDSLTAGGKILLCGNGGSAADAQHIAAEFTVRLKGDFNRPAIPALALTVDTSVLTAAGNDFGFDSVFSRQIEALGNAGDILLAISTSGNSANVLLAAEQAALKDIHTIGLLGGNGGKLKDKVEVPLVIPSDVTAHIQESHITIGHILCDIIEQELYGSCKI